MLINDIRKNSPLIHCITNPISINICANAVLGIGARPVMAEHPREISDITLSSQALLLNLGNITDARAKSIIISAKTANENNIPFVIDLAGVACSKLRRRLAKKVITKYKPDLIKGNYSEIMAVFDKNYKSTGVDADKGISSSLIEGVVIKLSKSFMTTVLASGRTDVISDGKTLVRVNNGTPHLSKITGTGCMQGALAAAFLSQCSGIKGVTEACALIGVCGELSETDEGSGAFMTNLLNNISKITDDILENRIRTEVKNIEQI